MYRILRLILAAVALAIVIVYFLRGQQASSNTQSSDSWRTPSDPALN